MSYAPWAVWRFHQLQPGTHFWHPPPWLRCSCRRRGATARLAQCRAMGDDMPRIVEDIPRRFHPLPTASLLQQYLCKASACTPVKFKQQRQPAWSLPALMPPAGVHMPSCSMDSSTANAALNAPRNLQAAAQLAPVRPHGGRVGRRADGAAGPVAAGRPGHVVGAPLRCPAGAGWAVRGRCVPDGAAVGGAS